MDDRRSVAGAAPAWIVLWLLTAAGSFAAGAVWTASPGEDLAGAPDGNGESAALRTARAALATSQRENESLRSELDRLVGLLAEIDEKGAAAVAAGGTGAEELPGLQTEVARRVEDLAARVREALARGADRNAAEAIVELTKLGAAAHPALAELYESSQDPAARRLLFPTLLVTGGREKGMTFLAEQLGKADEPDERARLLFSAGTFAKKGDAPLLKDTFLDTVADDSGPPRLRAYTVQALQNMRGPEVNEALFAAAGDREEAVRIAAVRALGARKSAKIRGRLEEILSRETSPLVRRVAECQLLIADHTY